MAMHADVEDPARRLESRGRPLSRRRLVQAAAAAGLAGWRGQVPGRMRPRPRPEGRIVISLGAEPSTLEWWNAYSIDGHPILRNVFEALLNRDPATNELVGELAESWEWTDDRTIRFKLREGVTYHNGDPLTAEDAAFGINYTWSRKTRSTSPSSWARRSPRRRSTTSRSTSRRRIPIRSCRPSSTSRPLPSARQIRGGAGHPGAMSRSAPGRTSSSSGRAARKSTSPPSPNGGATADPRGRARRAGDPGRRVRLAAGVVRARGAGHAGEAQIGRFLSPEDCATTPACKEAISVETVPLRLDTVHPVLKDIRVRQAIAHAIDKEAVVDSLFGSGEVATQLVGPSATGLQRGAGTRLRTTPSWRSSWWPRPRRMACRSTCRWSSPCARASTCAPRNWASTWPAR